LERSGNPAESGTSSIKNPASSRLPAGRRPPFTEPVFTGSVFGDMPLQFIAPKRLKSSAGAVQSIELGKFGLLTLQIAPFDPVGCNACIPIHNNFTLYLRQPRQSLNSDLNMFKLG